MNKDRYSAMITWGYYLIKGNLQGIPEFSGCHSDRNQAVLPDYDCIPSGNPKNYDARATAARCKITQELTDRIYLRHCKLFEQEKITFLNPRYTDLESAAEVKLEFFPNSSEWCVIGVGILDPSIKHTSEFRELPPLADGGTFLGFDLYEESGGYSYECPFRHCDMENKIPAKLGIALTDFGLVKNNDDAIRLAEHVNENNLGEPGNYVPFGIVRYRELS